MATKTITSVEINVMGRRTCVENPDTITSGRIDQIILETRRAMRRMLT